MPGIGTSMTVDVPTQLTTKNGNVTPNANSTQPRRCKSRQVSSRYMLPTASSMAASTSSRSASPIRRGRKSTDSNESNSRSASAERRRPNSPKEQNSEPIFQAVTNHTSNRPKAATSALWPSASSTNTALSRSGDSAKSSKTTDSTNSLATKENAHAHALGHGHGNNHVRVSVRSKSVESDVFTTNRHSSGYGRSSSSLHIRKKSADNNSSESASQGRLSVDLDLRPKDSGDDVFSNSSEGACSTPTRENCANPLSGENDSNSTDEGKKVKRMIRGSYVPARFLQDTLSRLRRLSDAGNISSSMKLNSHLRRASAAECSVSVPVIVRSKSNLAANGTPNPNPNPNPRTSAVSSARSNGNGSSKMSNMLNFGVEFFKGKRGVVINSAAQEETMHQLRLMHNRWLQWRFVNARAQASSEIQKNAAESSLYNVWLKTAQLRASVAMKRIQYDRLRYEQKIRSVIAAHASLLNEWEDIEEDHMVSVAEAKDCLDSATVRVPLVAGAKADVYEVKQVLGYSMQVMQGIQVSMNRFWQQADNVGSLLPELAEIVTQERALLQQTSEMLSILSSLEEEERSLKAHLIQMHRQVRQATATT